MSDAIEQRRLALYPPLIISFRAKRACFMRPHGIMRSESNSTALLSADPFNRRALPTMSGRISKRASDSRSEKTATWREHARAFPRVPHAPLPLSFAAALQFRGASIATYRISDRQHPIDSHALIKRRAPSHGGASPTPQHAICISRQRVFPAAALGRSSCAVACER